MLKFIKNYPAVFLKDESTLAIGDLHIGLTHELYKNGIDIPNQVPIFEKKIYTLIKKTKCKKMVIIGDIKHEVPGISYEETVQIPEFLNKLSNVVELHICKGNHDTHLEKIISDKINLHSSGGFRMTNYFFYHGHELPSEEFLNSKFLFLSHVHPVFEFKDKFGYKISKPVFLKLKIKKDNFNKRYGQTKKGNIEIILIPSFNDLLGGYTINRDIENISLTPLLNNIEMIKNFEVYLLDGTFLGKLNQLS